MDHYGGRGTLRQWSPTQGLGTTVWSHHRQPLHHRQPRERSTPDWKTHHRRSFGARFPSSPRYVDVWRAWSRRAYPHQGDSPETCELELTALFWGATGTGGGNQKARLRRQFFSYQVTSPMRATCNSRRDNTEGVERGWWGRTIQ